MEEKYVNDSSFIGNLAVLIYTYTFLFYKKINKDGTLDQRQSASAHLNILERKHAGSIQAPTTISPRPVLVRLTQ